MDSQEPSPKKAKIGSDAEDVQPEVAGVPDEKPKTDRTAPVVPLEELKQILSPINDTISALREEISQLRQQQQQHSLLVSASSKGSGSTHEELQKSEEEQDSDDEAEPKNSKSLQWIEVYAHCKDACDIVAYDEDDEELVQYGGYAPSFLSKHGSVHFKIDVATGTIQGWNKLTPVQILADLAG